MVSVEIPPGRRFNLTSEEGVLAFADGSIKHLHHMFTKYGHVKFGIVCIATRGVHGMKLSPPEPIPFLTEEMSVPEVSMIEVFIKMARDCHAIGVLFFKEAWVVNLEQDELALWLDRDLRTHPRAYETVYVHLQHQIVGRRAWAATITRGAQDTLGEFIEEEGGEDNFPSFLDHLAEHGD